MKKYLMLAVTAIALLTLPGLGRADVPSGMFRLHLETTLLTVGTGEYKYDGAGDQNSSGLTVGVGLPGMGIGFAGTLGRGWVLGGRVWLGAESDEWSAEGNADWFRWSLSPYFEYVFMTGIFRPFVTGMIAIEGLSNLDGNNDYSFWGLAVGGGGGAHIFVFNQISLDVTLMMDFRFGSGHAGNQDFSHWRFAFDTLFGISAWF